MTYPKWRISPVNVVKLHWEDVYDQYINKYEKEPTYEQVEEVMDLIRNGKGSDIMTESLYDLTDFVIESYVPLEEVEN